MTSVKTVAVVGGTGAEGGGLALRLAKAGYGVLIGGRDAGKAEAAASAINGRIGTSMARGVLAADAAAEADIVLMAVPYSGQRDTALALRDHLQGKILIDATVPLVPPKVSRVQLPPGGSAVAALQAELGEGVRVVAAFQNVSAHHLRDLDHEVDCDVLVCGDDAAAVDTVIALAGDIGLRGIYAGPVANAAAAEALTSLLIAINRRYKSSGSGIRITGI
ncbi:MULTISPECIES: NADPH-dependent F420 reductase [unclassified Chelatococcus]|uniref:NADPH-dependent F420 reductase n=1 Tax=unclassified Chelatococcus TaxID=2638111 RepID=UPI001BD1AE32|nr:MULTISPECIES: NADPH-dependent F420 reductase [unclassified Chelatococcus]MBS7700249.1 NADPH-dependent F420 reductase [Chelatococcus sp. YT9]MBX3558220.1 NADPH-dependent F420 reductase [Chelatococcus sp.]